MQRQGAVKGRGAKGKVHTYLGQAKFKPPPEYNPNNGKYQIYVYLLNVYDTTHESITILFRDYLSIY